MLPPSYYHKAFEGYGETMREIDQVKVAQVNGNPFQSLLIEYPAECEMACNDFCQNPMPSDGTK